MSRASRVPRDLNLSPEMRKFHDEVERRSQYVTPDGVADFPELYEDGLRVFVQGGNATGGLNHTAYDHGTKTSGSITITPTNGFHQKVICGGAFTIAVASISYYSSVSLHITNNASAGNKTITGANGYTGSTAFTNTDGDEFNLIIYWFGSGGADYMNFKRP